jgi:hypothetical protein
LAITAIGAAFLHRTNHQKIMKKLLFSFSILLLTTAISHVSNAQPPRIAIEVIIGSRPAAPREMQLMRQEEAAHPNIAKAMHDLEDGMRHLHDAPDDFGGHKAQAEADMHQALVSLRKALYFRLYEDRH